MDPIIWGPILSAVAALMVFGIKQWTAHIEKQKKVDHAISKRDRDELRAGMAAIDGMRDLSLPEGSQAGVPPGRDAGSGELPNQ